MRKRLMLLILAYCFSLGAAVISSADDGMSAEQIVETVWDKYRSGVNTERENLMVHISREGQAPIQKELVRWSKFLGNGELVTIKFQKPPADESLGLLIERSANASEQMWLRMPSWSRARKIMGNRETRYFGGTDLTFEDNRQLAGEKTTSFLYSIIENKADSWVIQAVPKPETTSGYAKRIFWVDDRYCLNRIDYYAASSELIKTQFHQDIDIADNGRWRPNKVIVKNFDQNSESVFEFTKREINPDLSSMFFSKRFLEAD